MNSISNIKDIVINHKRVVIILGVVILVIPLFVFLVNTFFSNKLKVDNLSDYSDTLVTENISIFSLNSESDYLYEMETEGLDGIKEFLRKNPEVNGSKLFPENFDKNVQSVRIEKDIDDQFLKKQNIISDKKHYFLEQKIGGVPIFGVDLIVHIKEGRKIYSISGNIVNNQEVITGDIGTEEAKQIALSRAQEEALEVELVVSETTKSIFNGKVIGENEDDTNYETIAVVAESVNPAEGFISRYFISTKTGEVIYVEVLIFDAKNRQVYDCNSATDPASCSLSRAEGGLPSGDSDVNSAYDFFGEIYDYYFNTFNRDSFNGGGATMRGYVDMILIKGGVNKCPNASYGNGIMYYCKGTVVKDVTAHEFTHGVTSSTASLIYRNQSGALNESISDVFASALDNNWIIGENWIAGVIRSMSDPPSVARPYPSADKLFSSAYWCSSGDDGGVHYNSGILNKAFYLMTDGGSFNGCNVSGIGRQRSHAIMYKALTNYLRSSSNFKDAYSSILQACNDIYSSDPGVCENVKSALQSTEMDQQPLSTQVGPLCSGGVSAIPECAGSATTPVPTLVSSITPATSPTTGEVRYFISGRVFKDSNGDGVFNSNSGEGLVNETLFLDGPYLDEATTLTDGIYIFGLSPGTFSVTYGSLTKKDIILNSLQPSVELNFKVTLDPANPTPTIVFGPTSGPVVPTPTAVPTSGPVSTPTPTPIAIYTCEYDSDCSTGKDNIQLCPLKCTLK